MGETAFMKVHAGYALNIGVSEDELKEIIYMVTVPAGFPRAIAASQTAEVRHPRDDVAAIWSIEAQHKITRRG